MEGLGGSKRLARGSPRAPQERPGAPQEAQHDPQEAPDDPQEGQNEPQEGQRELREVPGGFRERFGEDLRSIFKQRVATETLPPQIAGEGAERPSKAIGDSTRLLSRFWGGPRHSRLCSSW